MCFPFRMLAKGELVSLLQKCVEILQLSKSRKMKNALVQLEELVARFKQLDSELKIWFCVISIQEEIARRWYNREGGGVLNQTV